MARVPQFLIGKAPCMSVHMYNYSVEGPLISLAIFLCSISQAFRFEDVRAGLPLRSSFREFDSAILAPLPSGSWAQKNSYCTQSPLQKALTNLYMIKKLRGWIS